MSSLPRVNAASLLSLTEKELFEFPHDIFVLAFIDGDLVTTKPRTIWSWLLWEIHREYPLTPLSIKHHIGNRTINPRTHIDVLNNIKASAKEAYVPKDDYSTMIELNKTIHRAFNNMYNVLTVELEEYIVGANSFELLEVLKHPVIKAANDVIMTTPSITAEQIDAQHRIVAGVLMSEPSLVRNSVAVAFRSQLAKQEQLLQCISARGFMTEMDGSIFPVPMRQSYAVGMRTLSAYACESRTASISAFYQATVMKQFQYQNRSFQILNSDMVRLHRTDCGTRKYITIYVDSMKKLNMYIGKYILNDDDEWVVIDHKDKNLLNTPIRLRSMVNCIYPDRHGVCVKCFGELSTSIIDTDAFGQFVAAWVQQSESQKALSVKHFSSNSKDSPYELSTKASNYFEKSDVNSNLIHIKPYTVNNDGYATFKEEEIKNINNLVSENQLNDITANRYSRITQVYITVTSEDGIQTSEVVDVENGTKHSTLTPDALQYIIRKGWTIDEMGNYVVSLRDWDVKKPFLQVPRKKTDMVLAGKRVENFLKGVSTKSLRSGNDSVVGFNDFGDALMALQELSIEHMSARVSHLETLLYGLLAADPENHDYRLPDPLNRDRGKFVTFRNKIDNGNIAVNLAYERQGNALVKPDSFVYTNRSPSGFDWFIIGGEKLKKLR